MKIIKIQNYLKQLDDRSKRNRTTKYEEMLKDYKDKKLTLEDRMKIIAQQGIKSLIKL